MYNIISEGETRLYVPVEGGFGKRSSGKDRKPPVFYNSYMGLNRTLCVLFMKILGDEPVFADVLAGSGAKGLRVAVESGNKVFLNDANEDAVRLIKRNIRLNGVDAEVSSCDANSFLLKNSNKFDFIDIDPFGSPVPFIDSAILSSKKSGYIGLTATDTATLCGVYPGTCARRYQAVPLRSEFCHEAGLRILIGYAIRSAAKYDKGLTPVLSHSTRHYFRTYLTIKSGVEHANTSLAEMGFLYFCPTCKDFEYDQGVLPMKSKCECGGAMKISGPMWLGQINDTSFLKSMLDLPQEVATEKILNLLYGECHSPFYYNIHNLAKESKTHVPKMEALLQCLNEKGFLATRTHFSPISVKTNAPKKEIITCLH